MSTEKKISRKKIVIEEVFKICKAKNDFVFHNDLVKDVSRKIGVGNPFDVTKLDTKKKLPQTLVEEGYAVIHLGKGYHKFLKKMDLVFHHFEPIQEEIQWQYRKSLLNNYNTSESNILSVANNQRILHHFLFGEDIEFDDVDISKRPKTYFPHRTRKSFSYNFGKDLPVSVEKMQIEIDLTLEFEGIVSIFEAKNGKPDNFSIYQLYHPFLYYYTANEQEDVRGKIKEIFCVYMARQRNKKSGDVLRFWQYTFEDPLDITSIKLVKSVAYQLVHQE